MQVPQRLNRNQQPSRLQLHQGISTLENNNKKKRYLALKLKPISPPPPPNIYQKSLGEKIPLVTTETVDLVNKRECSNSSDKKERKVVNKNRTFLRFLEKETV
ncbi:hypothetical protein TNCT_111221 [Trichonephila clavata]|uniref:Uncharacterized protein n=1 Tax=Trichonephila clavata TaxID=2740835 RepID=A0A8X6H9Q2_TRICU|nr:hypothetical protein TNCT_111221 [Trichonephila clavata]